MIVWALHGFLGQPSDFDRIEAICINQNKNLLWRSLDYLHIRELSPQNSLEAWGENFNRYVSQNSIAGHKNVLLGYSQGGRLALHAIKKNPQAWKAAIIVSSNPGINAWERPSRLENDLEWSESFLTESFDKVVQRWNSAKVFEGSQMEPLRHEGNYNRRQLADCLINWSVAKQEDFRPYFQSFPGSFFYVCGEKDAKYCQIGKDLELKNRKIQLIEIKNSGHRVIFDQPASLSETILQIIDPK